MVGQSEQEGREFDAFHRWKLWMVWKIPCRFTRTDGAPPRRTSVQNPSSPYAPGT